MHANNKTKAFKNKSPISVIHDKSSVSFSNFTKAIIYSAPIIRKRILTKICKISHLIFPVTI